jgi:carboxylesterase
MMPRPTVIAVHGLGGSPASLGDIPEAFRRAGYTVCVPTLPGHGTTIDDLAARDRADWLAAVASHLDGTPTVLLGQSMGGLVALRLAAHHPEIQGVIAINTPIMLPDPDAVEHLEWLLERGKERVPAGEADLADPAATDEAYDELPVRALLELAALTAEVHGMVPHVAVPVMVVTSAADGIVDPDNGRILAERVGGPVTMLVLEHSRHVACLDLDRELLAQAVVSWLDLLSNDTP